MKSICFFSSYYNENKLPYYVRFYLEELERHFTQIVLLTNEKILDEGDRDYLTKRNIQFRLYKNEGYDFGMWAKAFKEFPVLNYDRIGLVNDSCILFKKLDFVFEWIDKNNFDYCGITDSNAIKFHIQSYFLVINKNAIELVFDYFRESKLISDIREVIRKYEVGLSQYLLDKNLILSAYYSNADYTGEHNPIYYFSDRLIDEGIPLIKKKIIYCSFRKEEYLSLMRMNFNIDPRYHIDRIRKANQHNNLIDFDQITHKEYNFNFFKHIWFFSVKSFLFQILRKFKRMLK